MVSKQTGLDSPGAKRPKHANRDGPIGGGLVVLPPIRRPMSPERREQAIEALVQLLLAQIEREAARRAGVSHPRAKVSRCNKVPEVSNQ